MHLARVTGWSYDSLMEMDGGELADWVAEAVHYHNTYLVPQEESK